MITNIADILPHLAADDHEGDKHYAALSLAYTAARTLYTALSYVALEQWGAAYVLLQACVDEVAVAATHHAECSTPDPEIEQLLRQTRHAAQGATARVHAMAFTMSQSKPSGKEAEEKAKTENGAVRSLLLDGLTFAKAEQLIEFPPNIQPIPPKPCVAPPTVCCSFQIDD